MPYCKHQPTKTNHVSTLPYSTAVTLSLPSIYLKHNAVTTSARNNTQHAAILPSPSPSLHSLPTPVTPHKTPPHANVAPGDISMIHKISNYSPKPHSNTTPRNNNENTYIKKIHMVPTPTRQHFVSNKTAASSRTCLPHVTSLLQGSVASVPPPQRLEHSIISVLVRRPHCGEYG